MTYPQSGSGYGQGAAGQPQYGQQAEYGQQQYGQQQYGQQQYGYGQQQYGQQQYGYQAPKPPSQGLPANTPKIIAAVVAGLGIIMLFLGFLSSGSLSAAGADKELELGKIFESDYQLPWGFVVLAGLLAATTFLIGNIKGLTAAIASLATAGAVITIFVVSSGPGKSSVGAVGDSEIDSNLGVGAILLLVIGIIVAIAAIVWLLIESGQIKTAPADAAAVQAQAAAAPATDASAYGYGQQAAAQPTAYGQQAQQTYQAGAAYGQPAAPTYGQPDSSPSNPTPGEAGPTTAFQKPDANS